MVALLDALLGSVAAHRVGQRPNRVEPRAVKRRPKAPKLLRVPRLKARQRLESGRAASGSAIPPWPPIAPARVRQEAFAWSST